MSETPELLVADAAQWCAWLASNHATSAGVRVVLAKKGMAGPTRLTHADALPEALCYGWIDGHLTRRDDATYCVRFTPRRPRSPWSQRNVETAERLLAEGRMQPAGLAEIERAKADGRWQRAYAGSASLDVPDDLRDALAASPNAQTMWDALTRTNKFAVVYRVQDAKRPETRARRIQQHVEMRLKRRRRRRWPGNDTEENWTYVGSERLRPVHRPHGDLLEPLCDIMYSVAV